LLVVRWSGHSLPTDSSREAAPHCGVVHPSISVADMSGTGDNLGYWKRGASVAVVAAVLIG